MKVNGKPYRTIWPHSDGWGVQIIDQTLLPHEFDIRTLRSVVEVAEAISAMRVRGAPLIGVTAAYGMALGAREDSSEAGLSSAYEELMATRPTAVNLRWALDRMRGILLAESETRRTEVAYLAAAKMADEDVAICEAIGNHGLELIRGAHTGERVNILTHCNAGWLATVDWGTALAPIYKANDAHVPVHVWVDETRPRNQGASLTSWELKSHGVPHTVIVDNAGGHLMQRGMVDLCIVGTDRTTACGDVCNKIGTYLKALAAYDNRVPFYVALPGPTIDFTLREGKDIPIEERDPSEVHGIGGRTAQGDLQTVRLTPAGVDAANYAFDVTPSRLVTKLITEKGVCDASEEGIKALYPHGHGA